MKIAVVHNLPSGGQKRALDYQIKLLSRNHKIDLYTPSDFGYKYPLHFPKSVASIYFSLPSRPEVQGSYRHLGGENNRDNFLR